MGVVSDESDNDNSRKCSLIFLVLKRRHRGWRYSYRSDDQLEPDIAPPGHTHMYQCKVASEDTDTPVLVVRVDDAPYSSSARIRVLQIGKNRSSTCSGRAEAIEATSPLITRELLLRTVVVT